VTKLTIHKKMQALRRQELYHLLRLESDIIGYFCVMQSFLNQLAIYSIEKHGSNLGNLTIVLPNRRAIVFLKEEFKKELIKASWLPQFFSLEDFIQQLGDYTILDPTDLLFKLYQVHKQLEGKEAEPLQEFLGWGTTLLQDFNEIDRYLVDAKELFGFLNEAKALEIWNLESTELTEFQHKYLRFWNKLGDYYSNYKQLLANDQFAYQGLGFRAVAENLKNGKPVKKEFNQLLFAGFNALTEAEKTIINYYVEQQQAEVIWDADEYYLNDTFQEAGKFLRDHKKTAKKEFSWISDNLLKAEKNISIYGVMGNVGQAKLIGNLIEANKERETAVVLSDEGMLVPVLEALPQGIAATNVTMGYPITSATVYSWLESYLNLYIRNSKEKAFPGFYHKDVRAFLQHNLNLYLSATVSAEITTFLSWMDTEKSIFIPVAAFEKLNKKLGFSAFSIVNNQPILLTQSVLAFIQQLRLSATKSLDVLNLECLTELEKGFNRLERLCIEEKELTDIQSLIEIFKQIVSQQSVSFVGEPLGGLQLMGVLESRTLDFENIIISSVNEGTLPSGKSQNSFIPFDIKRKFNLPSYQEKDAIFAYHFYRLLQRAKDISILYNSKVDQLEGGERSRFIEQLLHEFKSKNPNSTIQEISVSPKTSSVTKTSIKIPFTENIQNKVKYKFENRLSASALNLYLACPLSFYYRYVIGMKEEEVFQEKVEDNVLGNLVHESLKELYANCIDKVLNKELLKSLQKNINNALVFQFKEQLNTVATTGNHKLTYEVAKKFIESQIEFDEREVKQGHKIIIRELEQDHSCTFPLEINDQLTVNFNLFGKIDRIDEKNGKIRIIDYKTGGTKQADLKNKKTEKLLMNDSPKSVQLMLYKYMYWKSKGQEVDSGIISLKNISSGYLPLIKDDWKESFEDLLKIVAHKTLVDSTDLMHNVDSKYCYFCK
jgi:ATP-dependent helicase/nuclease subunit B